MYVDVYDFVKIQMNGLQLEELNGKYRTGCSALVRVTIKDGCYKEDIGYGSVDGEKSIPLAIEKSRKIAVSNGIKRYGHRLLNR